MTANRRVSEAYMVHDQRQLVGELRLGRWVVYLHEWLGEDCDLDTWKLSILAHAEQAGVAVHIFDVPRKGMTVVANAAALPTFDQTAESIAAMEQHRWTGHPIASERQAKTGREDPYATGGAPCPK